MPFFPIFLRSYQRTAESTKNDATVSIYLNFTDVLIQDEFERKW